jgi:hypothetical protein
VASSSTTTVRFFVTTRQLSTAAVATMNAGHRTINRNMLGRGILKKIVVDVVGRVDVLLALYENNGEKEDILGKV